MKIHIIGGSGAGKSTLARQLHEELHLPVLNLDEIFWDNSKNYGTKRNEKERNQLLHDFICQPDWIAEGIYIDWVEESLSQADVIFYLSISKSKAVYRMIRRYFRRNWKMEAGRSESLKQLIELIQWYLNKESKNESHRLKSLEAYQHKVFQCNEFDEVLKIIKEMDDETA